MNRRLFLLGTAVSLLGAFAVIAPAATQPLSTLSVKVMSVDRESLDRHTYRRESFQSGESSGGWSEQTRFVAKAQIETVLNSDHGLSPGAIIEIRYFVVQSSVPAEVRDSTLKTGETVTLTVIEGALLSGRSFYWRRPQ
jgi:hypothetical protein